MSITTSDFLSLVSGVCDQSFGIHVAELVHFPNHVIQVTVPYRKPLVFFHFYLITFLMSTVWLCWKSRVTGTGLFYFGEENHSDCSTSLTAKRSSIHGLTLLPACMIQHQVNSQVDFQISYLDYILCRLSSMYTKKCLPTLSL